MKIDEAVTELKRSLEANDYHVADGTRRGEIYLFNPEAVRTLLASHNQMRKALHRLCTGRRCTEDQECPLGSYFDCSVPEMIAGVESGPNPGGEGKP